ncbi:nucleobase:cation symporter-2 family protein [Shewanella benthica]|nr:nucleobase:cation symporter-2 family protein [Shewanella benthica]
MMENPQSTSIELTYGLDSKPPFFASLFAAIQHMLAMIVGVATPPILIGSALNLSPENVTYLVSMSLFMSGIGTFVQVKRLGGFIGSGLLTVQATSFAYPATIISIGTSFLAAGMTQEQMLSTIFGVLFAGSFVTIFASQLLPMLRKVITPTVSGITVMLIGISLVEVGMTDFAGGYASKLDGSFGSLENLMLGFIVLASILLFFRSRSQYIRMSAIILGMSIGYLVALYMGKTDFTAFNNVPLYILPIPFKFGLFQIDWQAFFLIGFVYLVVIIEAVGALTATCMLCDKPIEGKEYDQRISGGVLADGVISAIASVFNAFPLTAFSQNNGVIQMTGVASRKVGLFVAALLIIFGLFPVISIIFTSLPKPILGGATLILFGTVAAAGIGIITQVKLDRRESMIIAVSIGVSLGAAFVPDAIAQLPPMLQKMLGTPAIAGGLTALMVNLLLPRPVPQSILKAESVRKVRAKFDAQPQDKKIKGSEQIR